MWFHYFTENVYFLNRYLIGAAESVNFRQTLTSDSRVKIWKLTPDSGVKILNVTTPTPDFEVDIWNTSLFVHDRIYNYVADYNSSSVGVVCMSDVCMYVRCPRTIFTMGLFFNAASRRAGICCGSLLSKFTLKISTMEKFRQFLFLLSVTI